MATTDDPLYDCLAAIKTAWTAAVTLNGIGGPHLFEKPAAVPHAYPYAIVERPQAINDGWTCTSERWDVDIPLFIYHTTPESVRTQVNLARAVFAPESLSLTLSNGRVIRKRIDQSQIEQLGETVYRGSVPISLYVVRPRTA
jgi:hypothetical protein